MKPIEDRNILDVAFGSGMFYFDRSDVVAMDIRSIDEKLCDGRSLKIKPDIIADFKSIPFPNNTFYMVVFDPPHLKKAGDNSWLAKKYGMLNEATWVNDIRQGFEEAMRVLKPNGTLIFKWNEEQISLKDVLEAIQYKPILGNKRSKTHWLVFMK
jgi:ubiquinone/menaquinone biosynthesis C-methylase UbiE